MATAAHMLSPLPHLSRAVSDWVRTVSEQTQPRAIHWVEGSEAEARELTAQLLRSGELKALNAHPLVGEARGLGLIGGVELVADKRTKRSFAAQYAVGAKAVGVLTPLPRQKL